MSNEPGEYDSGTLRYSLRNYFKRDNYSTNRIKNVLLPVLLKKSILTRNELKKEFVKTGEVPDESQAGKFISLISTQLGQAKNDFLRQLIQYEYPDNYWTKDNFKLRDGYKDLVKELLGELDINGS